MNDILADGRWNGPHGIGRYSQEVLSRLNNTDVFTHGPRPLSLYNLYWQSNFISQHQKTHKVFFTPGFNAPLLSKLPFIITIYDLIHLDFPGKNGFLKKLFYNTIIKNAAKKACKVITVSEYSKNKIVEWAGLEESNVIIAPGAVNQQFNITVKPHAPGYSYLLHVGNFRSHKNIPRLLEAFSKAKIDSSIRLILTCTPCPELQNIITSLQLNSRIIIEPTLDDASLAAYYRGALALVFPSLYEGFGLPPLEAMACGTPVITSNTTSLPEIVQDAAFLTNPSDTQDISQAIEQVVANSSLRDELKIKGLNRVKYFSWNKTTEIIQSTLDTI